MRLNPFTILDYLEMNNTVLVVSEEDGAYNKTQKKRKTFIEYRFMKNSE